MVLAHITQVDSPLVGSALLGAFALGVLTHMALTRTVPYVTAAASRWVGRR